MKRLVLSSLIAFVFILPATTEDELMPNAGDSHTKAVLALRFSPDGRTLYSSGADGAIIAWDAETGLRRGVFYGHQSNSYALALSPDGKLLAAEESLNKTVTLWDAEARKKLATFYEHKQAVKRLDFSPDGRYLASAGEDGLVAVYDVAARKTAVRFRLGESALAGVEFSKDGGRLYAAWANGKFSVLDLANRKVLKTVQLVEKAGVNAMDVSADGSFVALAAADKLLYGFDLETLEKRFSLAGHTKALRSVAISPDGRFVHSGGYDGKVIRWDAVKGERVGYQNNLSGIVWDIAFTRDGERFACASAETIVLFESGQGKSLRLWMKK